MAITITQRASFHRGGATAQTHSFTTITLTAGSRYVLVFNGLRNGAGGWTPISDAGVTDDATAASNWTYLDDSVSGGASFTGGGTNGSAIFAFITDEITSTETGRTVTVDAASTGTVASATTAFLYSVALYEISSDSGSVSVTQTAGSAANAATTIDWAATPSGDILTVWGVMHNSTCTFPAEPTGFTQDYSDSASVPAIETHIGTSTSDPLSFSPTVSGTQFDWHSLGIEVTDSTGTTATPAAATGTGTASNPTVAAATLPSSATGTGSAADPTPAATASPPASTGTGAAADPATSASVLPAAGAGAGAANGPTPVAAPAPAAAIGTGAAADPSIISPGTATPDAGTGTGAANSPGINVVVLPSAATGTGAATGPVSGVAVLPSVSTGTGAAADPVVSVGGGTPVTATPAAAVGTGRALPPQAILSLPVDAATTGTGFAGVLAVMREAGRERTRLSGPPELCPVSAHRLEPRGDGYWVCPWDGLAYR